MPNHPILGVCTIEFHLPEAFSLKDKRSTLKSMLARLHNTFNVSAAEIDENDRWQTAIVGIAVVSNSSRHAQQSIDNVLAWLERSYPEAIIMKQTVEII
jgi:uncharacterized protein